jgi:outer membrane protein TolC
MTMRRHVSEEQEKNRRIPKCRPVMAAECTTDVVQPHQSTFTTTISATLVFVAITVVGCGQRITPAPARGISVTASPAISAPPITKGGAPDVAPAVPAAVVPTVVRLTRAEAVRMALSDNRAYRQKEGQRVQAEVRSDIAHADLYSPRLQAIYTQRQDILDDGNGSVTASVPLLGLDVQPFATSDWNQAAVGNDVWNSSVGVTVSRRVFALYEHLRQRLPVSEADTALFVAANDLVLDAKRVELETTRAFFAVQNADARAAVRARRVDDAKVFLDFISENVKNGFKAPVEQTFAEISLNQAQADLVRDRAAVRDAAERLLQILAQPLSAQVEVVVEDLTASPALPANLDGDLARIRTEHEELASQRARMELTTQQMLVARDALAPEVTAGVTAERVYLGDRAFNGTVDEDDRLSLSLRLDMPLDLQRSQRARYRGLVRQSEDQQLALAESAGRLEQQLRAAHRRIAQLRITVDLGEKRVAAERDRLAATNARYEAGAIDNLEVSRAKQALDDAEVSLLDARIELAQAAAEYRALLPALKTTESHAP